MHLGDDCSQLITDYGEIKVGKALYQSTSDEQVTVIEAVVDYRGFYADAKSPSIQWNGKPVLLLPQDYRPTSTQFITYSPSGIQFCLSASRLVAFEPAGRVEMSIFKLLSQYRSAL